MYRNYSVFSSKIYKLVLFIVYPLAAILGCLAVLTGGFGFLYERGFNYHANIVLLANGIILIEVISDMWLFNGIYSNNSNHTKLLACSSKGKTIFKNALIFDLLRRFIIITVLYALNAILGILVFNNDFYLTDVASTIIQILLVYSLSSLCIFAGRFTKIIWDNAIYAYIATSINALMIFILNNTNINTTILIIFLFILCIAESITTVWYGLKKLEDSYYDK